MKFYRVNVTSKGVLAFKEGRKLQATIERTKDGKFDCRCAFHRGQSLGGTYDKKEEAVGQTVKYLKSLDLHDEAMFNGVIDTSFILQQI